MSRLPEHVLVVGGGLIGLCSAYELAKKGLRVTVLDRDLSLGMGCSKGNAGMVVPSHFIPLAAPGVVTQGLKWMLNPKSPFYLRPRLDLALAKWCWEFVTHATTSHVEGCQELLRDLSLESRRMFSGLSEELGFDLVERGLLMLCESEEGLEEEAEVAAKANALGVRAEVCDARRLAELDPAVTMNALGGVWFPQDGHMDPSQFLSSLRREIGALGGELIEGKAVELLGEGRKIRGVRTACGDELEADVVVLAQGVSTVGMARDLGLDLPMQGGKGYSLTLTDPRRSPRLCSLLKEGRVAVTPMGSGLRVAGTMEICGEDLRVNVKRLRGMVESFCRFFPEFEPGDFEGIEPWSGLRPCSPDGLPYLGWVSGRDNVLLATGHAMLGLSLAPVTGRLVGELVLREEPFLPLEQLAPGRFH